MNDDWKEKYLSGDLSKADRLEFEKLLVNDSKLRAELRCQTQLDTMLEVHFDGEEKCAAIVESVMNEIAGNPDQTAEAASEHSDIATPKFRKRPLAIIAWTSVAAAVVLLFGLVFLRTVGDAQAAEIGVITHVFGSGVIERGESDNSDITVGFILRTGDTIRINDGYMYAIFKGGEGFELRDQFTGTFDASPTEDLVRISAGAVRVWPEPGPRSVRVVSQQVRVGASDSNFLVSIEPDGSRVENRTGLVEVEATTTGETVTLLSDQLANVGNAMSVGPIPEGSRY